MKNKKAMAMRQLLKLMVIVVGFFLVTGAVVKWGFLANEENSANLCKQSILMAAKSKESSAGETITGSLNCPRKDLILKKKDIVEGGKINQEKAHDIIAKEMALCWYSMGEGQIDPFSDFDEGSFCLICSTIKFDKHLQKYYAENGQKIFDGEIEETELQDYFITSPIPYLVNEPYKGSETYYEYLYNSDGRNLDLDVFEDTYIDEGSLILVKMYKDEGKNFGTFLRASATTALGVVLVVGGTVMAIASGGTLAAPGLFLIKFGAVTLAGAAVQWIAIAVFDPISLNAFSECETCEGIGGIKLIPPGYSLSTETKITYEDGGDTIDEEGPYCQYLVN